MSTFNFIKLFKVSLTSALICISALAHGHRFHAGITDISVNPNTGSTEIVHTFMAHDVEALLENLYQRQFDLSDSEDAAIFQRYVEQQFLISSNKQRLPLKWVGMKVDPNSVIIFQEIEHQFLPEQIEMRQAILTDFLADQVNTVNITKNGSTQTLTFNRSKREHQIP